MKIGDAIKKEAITSATRQVRQRCFSVCILPVMMLLALKEKRPQYFLPTLWQITNKT